MITRGDGHLVGPVFLCFLLHLHAMLIAETVNMTNADSIFSPLSASFMCTTKAMVSWLLRVFASVSAYSILCILEPFCFFHDS